MPVIALGGLGVVVAALMALLILYGAQQLARMIGNLVPDWHIPGLGALRSAVLGAARSALNAVASVMNHAAGPVAAWLVLPFHMLGHLVDILINTGQNIYNAMVRLRHYTERIYNLLRVWAAARINAVLHEAQRLYNMARSFAASAAAAVLHEAQNLYNLARSFAANAANTVLHEAQHLYNLARSYAASAAATVLHQAQNLYNLARSFAATEAATVLHEAQRLYNLTVVRIESRFAQSLKYADAAATTAAAAAVGVLTTDIAKVAHAEWISISDDVKALEGVIASDLPDIGALVRAVPRAVPLDIAATIGGVLALERVLTRYLVDCGIPNCRNLGRLGRDLADLLKMVEGAGFLAFLIALVDNPQATAHETHTVLDGLISGTVGATRDLLGV